MMSSVSITEDPQSTEAVLPLDKEPIFTPTDSALLIALAFTGAFTNMCVMLTLVSKKSLKMRSNWILVIHQSFTDFTSSVFVFFSYVTIHFQQSHVTGTLGVVYCKLIWSEALCMVGFFASSLNMTCLALERFIMVVFPSTYHEASLFKVKMTIVFIWTLSIVLAIPTGFSSMIDEHDFCQYGFFMGSMHLHQIYIILANCITFYIPILLMAFSYSYIFKVVRNRNRMLHPEAGPHLSKFSRSHMNLIMTSALMTTLFVVTWTPNQLYNSLYSYGFPLTYNDKWYSLSLMVVQLSSCLNPLIYVIKIKELRAAIMSQTNCLSRKTQVMDLAIIGRSTMDGGSYM
ncbi:hypothetical protein CAPTEDRAFT_190389 [Capitella teleta]|uniref:G-protein coupled receptors family 1 profile domain-containing protein n=1 Tax=Capitella teleta TaxID=283909 RepID=R7U876_CAPTE|nr:hypothetical protein CAPTEDRAFT_190389 [Capitella teleta]|eukprot:ELU02580.1 hypothetical protein CAPTEDRAFT_190389 [Capitella teleta]